MSPWTSGHDDIDRNESVQRHSSSFLFSLSSIDAHKQGHQLYVYHIPARSFLNALCSIVVYIEFVIYPSFVPDSLPRASSFLRLLYRRMDMDENSRYLVVRLHHSAHKRHTTINSVSSRIWVVYRVRPNRVPRWIYISKGILEESLIWLTPMRSERLVGGKG